jgi:SAM-dependent methyltransferase
MAGLDPLFEDWGAHWRRLVEAREAQASAFRDPAYWDKRARSFNAATSGRKDGFLELLEPWLAPDRTLIDVGAGAGRYAGPLAERLDWVTAVEPSQGMRNLIPQRDNMTVIASDWELAEAAPADLVICCHVLYGVADAVKFIEKLEANARLRVFIQLRHGELRTPADPLWELMRETPRARQPAFGDLWNLLEQMGIHADVSVLRYQSFQVWQDEQEFLDEYRPPLADAWDEARGRAWMDENLVREADGSLIYGRAESSSGVAHWQPAQ